MYMYIYIYIYIIYTHIYTYIYIYIYIIYRASTHAARTAFRLRRAIDADCVSPCARIERLGFLIHERVSRGCPHASSQGCIPRPASSRRENATARSAVKKRRLAVGDVSFSPPAIGPAPRVCLRGFEESRDSDR